MSIIAWRDKRPATSFLLIRRDDPSVPRHYHLYTHKKQTYVGENLETAEKAL